MPGSCAQTAGLGVGLLPCLKPNRAEGFPANSRAKGLVDSIFSKKIFIIAVIGVAKNIPTPPQRAPQSMSIKRITTGCRFRELAITLGLRMLPVTN